jgi:hypothetical protein
MNRRYKVRLMNDRGTKSWDEKKIDAANVTEIKF